MPSSFSVIAAVNDERLFQDNLMASPGLKEVAATIVPIRNAKSAAEAFYTGRDNTKSDWLLFSHQDVYFPTGTGVEIAKILAQTLDKKILGFVGMSGLPKGIATPAGLVLDRGVRLDWPATDTAISIDELAILIPRDSACRIDSDLRWDLWGTDLCLQSHLTGICAGIIRVLVNHNSRNKYILPDSFHVSGKKLAAKYPQYTPIHTLCGDICGDVK